MDEKDNQRSREPQRGARPLRGKKLIVFENKKDLDR
ncbi:hypothetical protein BMS3Abin17_01059 [archaeon BMS3Abin17]|nr:hypothetical protein BMS3Abin17_01059 [archaeon BMS3Abin17]